MSISSYILQKYYPTQKLRVWGLALLYMSPLSLLPAQDKNDGPTEQEVAQFIEKDVEKIYKNKNRGYLEEDEKRLNSAWFNGKMKEARWIIGTFLKKVRKISPLIAKQASQLLIKDGKNQKTRKRLHDLIELELVSAKEIKLDSLTLDILAGFYEEKDYLETINVILEAQRDKVKKIMKKEINQDKLTLSILMRLPNEKLITEILGENKKKVNEVIGNNELTIDVLVNLCNTKENIKLITDILTKKLTEKEKKVSEIIETEIKNNKLTLDKLVKLYNPEKNIKLITTILEEAINKNKEKIKEIIKKGVAPHNNGKWLELLSQTKDNDIKNIFLEATIGEFSWSPYSLRKAIGLSLFNFSIKALTETKDEIGKTEDQKKLIALKEENILSALAACVEGKNFDKDELRKLSPKRFQKGVQKIGLYEMTRKVCEILDANNAVDVKENFIEDVLDYLLKDKIGVKHIGNIWYLLSQLKNFEELGDLPYAFLYDNSSIITISDPYNKESKIKINTIEVLSKFYKKNSIVESFANDAFHLDNQESKNWDAFKKWFEEIEIKYKEIKYKEINAEGITLKTALKMKKKDNDFIKKVLVLEKNKKIAQRIGEEALNGFKKKDNLSLIPYRRLLLWLAKNKRLDTVKFTVYDVITWWKIAQNKLVIQEIFRQYPEKAVSIANELYNNGNLNENKKWEILEWIIDRLRLEEIGIKLFDLGTVREKWNQNKRVTQKVLYMYPEKMKRIVNFILTKHVETNGLSETDIEILQNFISFLNKNNIELNKISKEQAKMVYQKLPKNEDIDKALLSILEATYRKDWSGAKELTEDALKNNLSSKKEVSLVSWLIVDSNKNNQAAIKNNQGSNKNNQAAILPLEHINITAKKAIEILKGIKNAFYMKWEEEKRHKIVSALIKAKEQLGQGMLQIAVNSQQKDKDSLDFSNENVDFNVLYLLMLDGNGPKLTIPKANNLQLGLSEIKKHINKDNASKVIEKILDNNKSVYKSFYREIFPLKKKNGHNKDNKEEIDWDATKWDSVLGVKALIKRIDIPPKVILEKLKDASFNHKNVVKEIVLTYSFKILPKLLEDVLKKENVTFKSSRFGGYYYTIKWENTDLTEEAWENVGVLAKSGIVNFSKENYQTIAENILPGLKFTNEEVRASNIDWKKVTNYKTIEFLLEEKIISQNILINMPYLLLRKRIKNASLDSPEADFWKEVKKQKLAYYWSFAPQALMLIVLSIIIIYVFYKKGNIEEDDVAQNKRRTRRKRQSKKIQDK